jgi:hypothetical protein
VQESLLEYAAPERAEREERQKGTVKKFGRFEFKAAEPVEVYEGDRMELERAYVKIVREASNRIPDGTEDVVAIVHLDKAKACER